MKEYSINKNIRGKITTISLIVSIFICLAIQLILNNIVQADYEDNALLLYLSLFIVPSVFGLTEFFKYTIFKWLWKVKWLNRIIGIPNLNGEWEAVGKSDYNNETEFYGVICITQTMTKIKIAGIFGESKSVSTLTYLKIDDDGSFEVSYQYENTPKPNMKDTMQKHCGYMMFFGKGTDGLEGEYFNDRFRGSKGTLKLVKKNTNDCKRIEG